MLGLTHLLFVSTTHGEKARIVLRDIDQSCYGFAATSINFSLMALNALRSGFLRSQLQQRLRAVRRKPGAFNCYPGHSVVAADVADCDGVRFSDTGPAEARRSDQPSATRGGGGRC
jgi:hypothetical protein